MKKIITAVLLLALGLNLTAQRDLILSSPDTQSGRQSACNSITLTGDFHFKATEGANLTLQVDAYPCTYAKEADPSQDQNYIITRIFTQADKKAFLDQIQYFDGLGRPIQTIQMAATPNGDDLVSYQEYDAFGRESNSWLPAPTAANGAYVSDPKSVIKTYYSNDSAFSKPVYEESPLDRVLEQYGPGKDWHTNKKSMKTAYMTNVSGNTSLKCSKYLCLASGSLSLSGNYDDGQLYVTEMKDEDGNTSYEFKDKLGRVVLTRQINDGQNHDTYYVYDDFGNLRFVLPPLAADANGSTSALNLYGYQYRYDHRNRCIEKKLPGCEAILYVYDKADQLIYSQDGEQYLAGKWMFNKYDAHGRLIMSGLHSTTKQHATLINECKDIVVRENIDPNSPWYGYSVRTLTGISHTEVRLVNYYDNYDIISGRMVEWFAGGEGNINDPQPTGFGSQKMMNAKGLLVATMDFFEQPYEGYVPTVYFYDKKGNMVQRRTRPSMGLVVEYVDYNFINQPTKRRLEHRYAAQTESYAYIYDHTGRLTETTHSLNGATAVSLSKNTYDELGRLSTTTMANNTSKLKTTYSYNIRSWLLQADNPMFSQKLYYNDTKNLHGPRKYYNGNVSYMDWTQNENTHQYVFDYDNLSRLTQAWYAPLSSSIWQYVSNDMSTSYTYDKHGNVTTIWRSGYHYDFDDNEIIDDLFISYHGNQIKRVVDEGYDFMYNTFGDFKNNTGTNQGYVFNDNGAMTTDPNKGATNTYHLYSQMPKTTSVKNNLAHGLNIYYYSATGKKLGVKRYYNPQRTVQPVSGSSFAESDFTNKGIVPTETFYTENLVFENYSLKRILIDNGYIENGNYYFYFKDHLGNNRLVVTQAGAKYESTDYYPFGMKFGSTEIDRNNPYKYGGKEYDTSHGLNQYDFHARTYDQAIIRFTSMDPLAEKFYSWSPYVYCYNNPLKFVDPDGRNPALAIIEIGKLIIATGVVATAYTMTDGFDFQLSDVIKRAPEKELKEYSSTHEYSDTKAKAKWHEKQEARLKAEGEQKNMNFNDNMNRNNADGSGDNKGGGGKGDGKMGNIISKIVTGTTVFSGVVEQLTNPNPRKDAHEAQVEKAKTKQNQPKDDAPELNLITKAINWFFD